MGKNQQFDATLRFGDDNTTEVDTVEAPSLAEAEKEIKAEAASFDEAVGDPNAVTVESVKPHKS